MLMACFCKLLWGLYLLGRKVVGMYKQTNAFQTLEIYYKLLLSYILPFQKVAPGLIRDGRSQYKVLGAGGGPASPPSLVRLIS